MARNREITRNYLLGLKQAEESYAAMAANAEPASDAANDVVD